MYIRARFVSRRLSFALSFLSPPPLSPSLLIHPGLVLIGRPKSSTSMALSFLTPFFSLTFCAILFYIFLSCLICLCVYSGVFRTRHWRTLKNVPSIVFASETSCVCICVCIITNVPITTCGERESTVSNTITVGNGMVRNKNRNDRRPRANRDEKLSGRNSRY